jgi:peptidoglycan LD-endopeptidase CwlK
MSSRDLNDLRDDVRFAALAHTDNCHREGVDLLIYCTLRPNEEQATLYAQGRTALGKIVTNARPGQSAHNPQEDGKALAYDCVPLRQGKPVWGTSSKEDSALWGIVGRCGEAAGLSWSGRWSGSLREIAHFQATYFQPNNAGQ